MFADEINRCVAHFRTRTYYILSANLPHLSKDSPQLGYVRAGLLQFFREEILQTRVEQSALTLARHTANLGDICAGH